MSPSQCQMLLNAIHIALTVLAFPKKVVAGKVFCGARLVFSLHSNAPHVPLPPFPSSTDFIQCVGYPFFALWHQFCKSGLSHNLIYYLSENQRIWGEIANRATVRVSDDSADEALL